MTKKGFTIIELLIVIAIIGILAGVAVPYYNDYIYDARLSTLKQNLATYRQVLNQFRGDNLRGPINVPVSSGAVVLIPADGWSSTAYSELTAGPIQIVDAALTRRTNLKYLPQMPVFLNPQDGSPVPPTAWNFSGETAYYYDPLNVGVFDIDNELAFVDNDGDASYTSGIDTVLFLGTNVGAGGAGTALDYTSFSVTIDGVDY
ncbi:MAG: hypothetical protein CVV42_01280 [Candidatus Riflebacteria bacterium HGW-Riflebacteria-2]|jgi:prepilin-type N-terminal cleavage/methylation domain-containing protein|nr:MAG: hypothetical protein CVV42_01280 [Candidatus Riflebacteria bacterium HGW-Riflebacteria-2]